MIGSSIFHCVWSYKKNEHFVNWYLITQISHFPALTITETTCNEINQQCAVVYPTIKCHVRPANQANNALKARSKASPCFLCFMYGYVVRDRKFKVARWKHLWSSRQQMIFKWTLLAVISNSKLRRSLDTLKWKRFVNQPGRTNQTW